MPLERLANYCPSILLDGASQGNVARRFNSRNLPLPEGWHFELKSLTVTARSRSKPAVACNSARGDSQGPCSLL